jgi:hypothetical protein
MSLSQHMREYFGRQIRKHNLTKIGPWDGNQFEYHLKAAIKSYDELKKASQSTQNQALIKVMALAEPKNWQDVCEKDPDYAHFVRYEWSRLNPIDKKLITLKMQKR